MRFVSQYASIMAKISHYCFNSIIAPSTSYFEWGKKVIKRKKLRRLCFAVNILLTMVCNWWERWIASLVETTCNCIYREKVRIRNAQSGNLEKTLEAQKGVASKIFCSPWDGNYMGCAKWDIRKFFVGLSWKASTRSTKTFRWF